jgi:mannose-6-phosphate isomerase-like protein (cupin superfamily)
VSATAESKTKFAVVSLDELEPHPNQEGRLRKHIRSDLGIMAFGINAVGTSAADVQLINEHDEAAPWSNSHEEVYVVISGHATFTVDGEEIDAPAGTLVYVGDRNAKRSAVALEAGTRAIAIGATPGEAFAISVGEAAGPWFAHYEAKEYEEGLAILEAALADYPDSPLLYYNIACCESLLGRKDEALGHLKLAIKGHAPFVELAREDRDFDPVREDPRFEKLVA